MKRKHILHTIREEKNKGYKHLYRVRRTLMKALKEYLRQKYGRKVCFILPVGDPLGDLLDERNFYPSSVTVYDKHGYAACSAAVSMELEIERNFISPYVIEHSVDDRMTLEKVKEEYHESDVCMGETLLSIPATGLSVEEAFELAIEAKKWADGDKFYRVINDNEPEEL